MNQSIGRDYPPELHRFRDPKTGRHIEQLTSGRSNSYPLYYFTPSITADGRYLVFHGERTGWVQLFRLDLQTGQIVQLTDARTMDSGWAMWCQWRLRGVYVHLSALNRITEEVWYFQDQEVRATHLRTLTNRKVADLPSGRMPIGQNDFSPDGSGFVFIHADRERYLQVMRQREALANMGHDIWGDHQSMREQMGPVTLGYIDTATGQYREIITRDFHFHHVVFAAPKTMVVNHPKGCNGMWSVDLDGGNVRHLRPGNAPGAGGAEVCHQVITANGIFYEANHWDADKRRACVCVGRYDLAADSFREVRLGDLGFVHTGWDPAGRFLFIESAAKEHRLLSVHFPHDSRRLRYTCIRALGPSRSEQRFHAHPFLTPDRNWMVFTDLADNGFGQIFRLNVSDLANLPEYW